MNGFSSNIRSGAVGVRAGEYRYDDDATDVEDNAAEGTTPRANGSGERNVSGAELTERDVVDVVGLGSDDDTDEEPEEGEVSPARLAGKRTVSGAGLKNWVKVGEPELKRRKCQILREELEIIKHFAEAGNWNAIVEEALPQEPVSAEAKWYLYYWGMAYVKLGESRTTSEGKAEAYRYGIQVLANIVSDDDFEGIRDVRTLWRQAHALLRELEMGTCLKSGIE